MPTCSRCRRTSRSRVGRGRTGFTEFGPRGHWQVEKTAWKLPIEDNCSQKADFYRQAYEHAVQGQLNCLGAFVFHWDQHHEKTHTWYAMFLEDGSHTEAVDVMTFLWSGK